MQWKNAASPILLAYYFSLDIRLGIAYNAALKLCTILLYTEGYRPEKTLQHFHVRCLFELRPRGREGIGRVFYCFVIGQHVVILHAFVKKTPDTPEPELKIAKKRMKEVRNG